MLGLGQPLECPGACFVNFYINQLTEAISVILEEYQLVCPGAAVPFPLLLSFN
jgi:hypothetical protein